MRFFKVFCLVFVLVMFANVDAFAVEDIEAQVAPEQVEEISEVSRKYANGRNISQYMRGTSSPLHALTLLAGKSSGNYKHEVIHGYVAYELAVGGRDLSTSNYLSRYRDSDLKTEFETFYGMNGANANNSGEPITADSVLDKLEDDMPRYFKSNPGALEEMQQQQMDVLRDLNLGEDEIEGLVRSTKLNSEVVKMILIGMQTGKVSSKAVLENISFANERALEFVRANFSSEMAEAKRISERAEKYFASYRDDMAGYDAYMENMRSDNFETQFKEYAKYFTPEQKDQAMLPYINEAKQKLDRAKVNYQLGVRELEYLEKYLQRIQKQKIQPALDKYKRQNSSLTSPTYELPRFAAGIFSFAAEAVAGLDGFSELDMSSITDAFSSEVNGLTDGATSTISGFGEGFNVNVEDFSEIGGSVSSIADVATGAASINTSTIATADVGGALGTGFVKGTTAGTGDAGALPTRALTRYWRPTDNVKIGNSDFQPKCDASDKTATGNNERISRFSPSACTDRKHRLTAFGGSVTDFFSLQKKSGGIFSSEKGSASAKTSTSAKYDSIEDLFEAANKKSSSFIKSRSAATSDAEVVLTQGQLNERQDNQQAGLKAAGYDLSQTTRSTRTVTNGGADDYENFNPTFPNGKKAANDAAISQGYCLMIEDKNGKFRISENSAYVPTYDPRSDPDFDSSSETRHIKYNLGSGKKASPQRIVDPSHPFSPMHEVAHREYINPINSMCGGGQYITQVCGTDEKSTLGGVKAWEPVGAGGGKDYGMYKKPIVDNGGKIMTTPPRLAGYTATAVGAYAVCMAATFSIGETFCCDMAEHLACQTAILPGFDMKNKLALSYTLAHAQDDGDKELPHVNENAYDSYRVGLAGAAADAATKGTSSVAGMITKNVNNGYNWKTSYPQDKFGNNGPWPNSSVTGEMGFGGIEDLNKEDYAQYMLTIAGVNPGYSAGEDNSNSTEARNSSCGAGGWAELVRYQENCARFAGVDCICDYQKAFFRETSWGYVLDRVSAFGKSIDNRETSEQKTVEIDGKQYSRSVDTTKRMKWNRSILASLDGRPINAQANYNLGGDDDVVYPSKNVQNGLSNAKPGTVIVMQTPAGDELTDPDSTHGDFKRPWLAAFVENVHPATGCVVAKTKNNHSVFLDACGNSENLGEVTEFEICPPTASSSKPSCETDHDSYSCKESLTGWNSWVVHNFYNDKESAYDPETGEAVDNAECADVHQKINAFVDDNNSGSEESRAGDIEDLYKEAKARGCPPDPNWGVSSGNKSTLATGDKEKPNYVPASASETGVPMNFDFIGFIGSLLDKLTGGGDVFPKIKEVVTGG